MTERRKIEIMAPAGDFESLSAALRSGADSVYFGVGSLNMRSRSSANFTLDDMARIAGICRRMKRRSYLALNTVIYDSELDEVEQICRCAVECGISAVIASDIAVMETARRYGLEVHISVQSNVSNTCDVRFFSRWADVMVLARELNLEQIRHIADYIRREDIRGPSGKLLQLELFAHGALCVAVSGKCYMSLGVYNSAANRGACFQNCRRKYLVSDAETGEELVVDNHYVMSPKDICTLPVLDQIMGSGVTVLKIEGRGRSSAYVSKVVKAYREAADAWSNNRALSESRQKQLIDDLESVFNRGFWKGYYLGAKLGEWSDFSGNRATVRREYRGEVTNYFSRLQVAEVQLLAGELKIGDKVLICGNTTGALEFEVSELRRDLKNIEAAEKGDVVSLPVPRRVRRKDQIYLLKNNLKATGKSLKKSL